MNKIIGKILLILGCVLIIGYLIMMDYSDLSWNNNMNAYLGFIVAVSIVVNGIVNLKHKSREEL